jgi:hypothetical protein
MGIKKVTFKKPQRKTNSHHYVTLYEVGKHLGVSKYRIHGCLNAHGSEGFFNIPELRPFAHLFEQFKRTENDQKRAFGIKKVYWNHYLEYGKIPEKMGAKPLDPLDPDSYRVKCLRFKAPPFYGRFKAGLVRANRDSLEKITLEQAVWMALEEFMHRRPEQFYPDEVGDNNGWQEKVRE